VSGKGSCSFFRSAKRYEVQFQDDSQRHSDTNDVEQATYLVYDRAAQKPIFRPRTYAEERRDDSIGNPRDESQYTTKGEI
jgi:hypothetical protein